MNKIPSLYKRLLNGTKVGPRGKDTLEILNCNLEFEGDEWFIDPPGLETNKDYVATEMLWYLEGCREDLSICDHAKIWKDCVNVYGALESNYGYYLKEQIDNVVGTLANDIFSRRAVMTIFNYNPTGLEHANAHIPDSPCTLSIQFIVRESSFHKYRMSAVVTMRSQDAVFGLRNDLPAFQLFRCLVAYKLGKQINKSVYTYDGKLYLNVGSMHAYRRHVLDIAYALKWSEDRHGWIDQHSKYKSVHDVQKFVYSLMKTEEDQDRCLHVFQHWTK